MRVIDVTERRGPASLTQTLYEDLTPKEAPGPDTAPETHPGKRPTKRDRRRLDAFRSGDA